MTVFSLYPGYVRLDYHSSYAPHSMLLPAREWLPTSITGTLGSYVGWNSTPIDAEDMVDAMVDVLAAQHKSTTIFDLATIYTLEAANNAPAVPVASKTYAVAGSNGVGGPDKATQVTLSGRSKAFHPMKIVFLDCPVGTSNFNKVLPAGFPAQINAIIAEWADDGNAWQGRDGAQLLTAISMTITLNERLRDEYRMA